jgi:predicted MPP superfamily phosphohydrolase
MTSQPNRFGRGRTLSRAMRAAEVAQDLAYRGGWPAALARRLGAQGTLRVSEHAFTVSSRRPEAPPLRLAFASDFHAGPLTHRATLARACEVLAQARADVLLLGGDFVSMHARFIDDLAPMLATVPAPLGAFAVLGNHDLWVDDAYVAARLERAGVRVLINRSARLPPPHDDVWLCGLDDPDDGAPDARAAFAGADGVRLVLMHSPDGLTAIGDRPFAVAFCGHTHGGQFVLPGGRSLVVPRGPLSRRYLRAGVFRVDAGSAGAPSAAPREATLRRGERLLLVSRGVGCTLIPFRRGVDPEVHVCALAGSEGGRR